MNKKLFTGSAVALVTPFKNDGTINFEKVGELIDYHIENQTDAIVIAGTTGEAATLEYDEHEKLIEYAVKYANNRIKIIAGTGSNNTRRAVELTQKAESYGADFALSVTPYYNKCTQEGLIAHYEKIADSVKNMPIIMYNVPSRTGVNIEAKTAIELSSHQNIVGLKEASENLQQVEEIIRGVNPDHFYVYSGNDDQTAEIIKLGGKGVISVLANICPQVTHEMCEYAIEGEEAMAQTMQKMYSELIKELFRVVNPIPIKEAMNYLGYDVGDLRLPLTNMTNEKVKRRGLVKTLELYKDRKLLK